MGKLDGKVAVITGGSSGLALAGAKLFVDEGAYVFITGRRQEALDEAVKLIGRDVTSVQADSANLGDLVSVSHEWPREWPWASMPLGSSVRAACGKGLGGRRKHWGMR